MRYWHRRTKSLSCLDDQEWIFRRYVDQDRTKVLISKRDLDESSSTELTRTMPTAIAKGLRNVKAIFLGDENHNSLLIWSQNMPHPNVNKLPKRAVCRSLAFERI